MTLDAWAAKSKSRTDEWIAAQVGLDRTTITHIRNRNRRASLATAIALSKLTRGQVPVEEFLQRAPAAAPVEQQRVAG